MILEGAFGRKGESDFGWQFVFLNLQKETIHPKNNLQLFLVVVVVVAAADFFLYFQ